LIDLEYQARPPLAVRQPDDRVIDHLAGKKAHRRGMGSPGLGNSVNVRPDFGALRIGGGARQLIREFHYRPQRLIRPVPDPQSRLALAVLLPIHEAQGLILFVLIEEQAGARAITFALAAVAERHAADFIAIVIEEEEAAVIARRMF